MLSAFVLISEPPDIRLLSTFPIDLAVAAFAGLAVGIEREWSGHASGPGARFAGVRTFFMLGLLGGVAGWLTSESHVALAVVVAGGAAALTVAAYWLAVSQHGVELDGTTETAALAVIAIGAVAGLGEPVVAGASAAVITWALGEKARIHGLVRRIGESEMRATLEFAVLAFAILPLLPAGPFGPLGGVRPRLLWGVVLFFSGLSFVGYLVRHAAGEERGDVLAGILGGVLSSTAVTLDFGRASRQGTTRSTPLALGVAGACGVLLLRVLVTTLVLDSDVCLALVPYVIVPFAISAMTVLPALRQATTEGAPKPIPPRNPLRLGSALRMAVGFQLLLMGFQFVRSIIGAKALMPSAALLGLTDVDALTLAMTQYARTASAGLAAKAIAVGILANTGLKIAIALTAGSSAFGRGVAWRLALQGTALTAALLIMDRW